MTWNVRVDDGVCIGSGMCLGAAPAHFDFDDDTGLSRAQREEIEPDDAVLEAAQVCPVEAILVRDNAGGRLLAPAE
ncbi:ferredoxin [Nocardiopsis trehalosi]|jgi:ferredoxin|uniref:ferredoxin n=1 Tax=Nocardiopsis trehalosi TaxID=109329 RepID=UPI00082DFB3E|nr:ferredoxin [Nocardiopsis trehalosi]